MNQKQIERIENLQRSHKGGLWLAMEWGFKAAEKGINLQEAQNKFQELMK